MPDFTTSEHTHRFGGSTLESMLEVFTRSFGPLVVAPLGDARDFRWNADFWRGNGVSLVTSHHEAECYMQVVADRPQYVSVMMPRVGGINLALGSCTVAGRPGEILLTNNVDPERVSLRGKDIALDGLLFDHSIFAHAVAGIFDVPLNGTLELFPILELHQSTGRLIGCLTQTLIEGMRNDGPLLHSPLAMSNLSSAFAELVLREVPHRLSYLLDKPTQMIAPWHVRRAVNFMHANIDQQITISTIAQAVGTSVRALENGFRAFKETTPATYLRTIRLIAARADLLDPANQQTVKEICLKWGFFHFGRFSILYRTKYGENPSETKRRSTRM